MDEYYDYGSKYYDHGEHNYEEPNYNRIYHMEDYYYDNDYYDDNEGESNYYDRYELYPAEKTTKAKRQSRRMNPMAGQRNDNDEENLQEELERAGNRMNEDILSGLTTPSYNKDIYENSQNWDYPIGPENFDYNQGPKTKDGRFY